MSDGKWLWDQPKSWHDMNRALQDISVLLNFLGEMPEARLLSYFDDTKNRITDGALKTTVPPCASYPEFLNRLQQIASAFHTGRVDLIGDLPPDAEGQPRLSPIAFVYWSRDFLAAVAAPATAYSIRLTHDYMQHRARSVLNPIWKWHTRRQAKPAVSLMPQLPDDPEAPAMAMVACKLARWVRGFEWLTVCMVVAAVVVSIYALSGRLILANGKDAADAWSKLEAQLESQEEKIFPSAAVPVGAATSFGAVPLCDVGPAVLLAWSGTGTILLPNDGTAPDGPKGRLMPRHVHLCAQQGKALADLFVVEMHLQSWSSVIASQIQGEVNVGYYARAFLAAMFGIMPATLREYAKERQGGLCDLAASGLYEKGAGPVACERALWTLINRSRNVAESILGSITQYILPVCYGFLGAMAAALRLIRRKVDGSLLSPTDRTRLQQGAILGVLCGAVIGLFASYVSKSDSSAGLGLSALALLAGYNVDGVFRFLDELSDRIFRPAVPAK